MLVALMFLLELINISTYLGLNFYTDLSWSQHVGLVCKKTRKLLGMLYRNFYQFTSSHILVKLYKSLIRPHIEYTCSVWDPHLKKDIQALENVQKFALRICSINHGALTMIHFVTL